MGFLEILKLLTNFNSYFHFLIFDDIGFTLNTVQPPFNWRKKVADVNFHDDFYHHFYPFGILSFII